MKVLKNRSYGEEMKNIDPSIPPFVKIDHQIHEIKTINQLIKKGKNQNIVLWFEGASGTRQEGFTFYLEEIFTPFYMEYQVRFHLYDLSSWRSLRDNASPLTRRSKISLHINSLNLPKYSSLFSADFFTDLQTLDTDLKKITYIHQYVLTNITLFRNSFQRTHNGIKLKEIIRCNALEPIEEIDTAHAYSLLQYLEVLYLIKTLAKPDTSLIFLLPNDESKYYDTSRLEEDIENLIDDSKTHKMTISFINFKFGKSIKDRPYISKGKKLKKSFITKYLISPT